MTADDGAAFAAWWSARFGTLAPLGYVLRLALDARWLRIHSLPESKRYASNDAEHAEVLHRARTMAAHVFVDGDPVWVVTCLHDEPTPPSLQLAAAPALRFSRGGVFALEDESRDVHAYATQVTWPHPGLDALVAEIAADRERVVWASARSGEVFAPYDGGVDVILVDRARRDMLATQHTAWRSKHPRGL